MTGSPPAASCILGRRTASMSNTQGGSRVPKLGLLGSVRGVRSNAHPYRKHYRPVAVSREWLVWRTATADIGAPLPPHFCNRSHVPASLNTHPCRQYLRYKVMSLNDFALSFPQRLGADPAASLACRLHLKFTPSSSPTISRALRTQNL